VRPPAAQGVDPGQQPADPGAHGWSSSSRQLAHHRGVQASGVSGSKAAHSGGPTGTQLSLLKAYVVPMAQQLPSSRVRTAGQGGAVSAAARSAFAVRSSAHPAAKAAPTHQTTHKASRPGSGRCGGGAATIVRL